MKSASFVPHNATLPLRLEEEATASAAACAKGRKSPERERHHNPSLPNMMLKVILAEKGMCISDLAGICGCSAGHVYNVITKFRKSRRVLSTIEDFIGLPLWSNPQKKIAVPLGESGLAVHIPAIEVVLFKRNLREVTQAGPRYVEALAGLFGAAVDGFPSASQESKGLH